MPTHWEIEVETQLRSFILDLSPDWAAHMGDLTLVVALHGGRQPAEQFQDTIEIDALVSGTLTGTPEKLVAIFPRGLDVEKDDSPVWNAGHMGQSGDLHALDDVLFVKEVIEKVNTLLADEYQRLTGLLAPSPFYRRFLLCGFSNGGNLALKCNADLERYDGVVAWGSVVPDTIAVSSSTSGGIPLCFQSRTADPLAYELNPALAGVALDLLTAGGRPANLIQNHSWLDQSISIDGAVAPEVHVKIDASMGGTDNAGDGYYRWDVPSGVRTVDRLDPDPPTTWAAVDSVGNVLGGSTGIGPWLPTTTTSSGGVEPHFRWWSWAAGGREVRYYMSDTSRNGGHAWPSTAPAFAATDGWSFTLHVWEFLDLYFP